MSNFSNELLLITDLPKYEEVKTSPVQQTYWNVLLIKFLLSLIFYGGVCVFLTYIIDDARKYLWYIIAAILITGLVIFILLKKSFKRRSYALRERDVLYKHGILSISTTIIPFNRIQHIVINEGFISRLYNLAELKIYTAGGDLSDLKISGLLKDDAEKIKEAIIGRLTQKNEDQILE